MRAGAPPYLVARPLTAGLESDPRIAFEHAVPARLVERLRAGTLDVALVSSIELFRQPGYSYLAGPAVAAKGEIASVQVFLKQPLERVRRVDLDPTSRTAQALVQIVLPSRAAPSGERIRFSEGSGQGQSCDAWLEIGDPALLRRLSAAPPPSFDPAAAWTEETGLPFVFAVWIARAGFEPTGEQCASIEAARQRGRQEIDALAREASRVWGLPQGACAQYLTRECRFEPGNELEPALREFQMRAARLDLCRGDYRPRAIAMETQECRD